MYDHNKTIREFTDSSEIVGYWRNHGHEVSITVSEVKEYFPKKEWSCTMSSAVKLIKELNEQ